MKQDMDLFALKQELPLGITQEKLTCRANL